MSKDTRSPVSRPHGAAVATFDADEEVEREERNLTSVVPWSRNSKEQFLGPLFLVGMPRSGTKLLRNLLNQHSRIHILTIETDFLPMWIKRWHSFGDLSEPGRFQRFYSDFLKLPYSRYAYSQEGIGWERWYAACRDFSPSAVFEALVRVQSGLSAKDEVIWGDKSPSYIRHLSLLDRHFPSMRAIHLIRDVRDQVLSVNSVWGKNMHRAAQRWNDDVACARAMGKPLRSRYCEVKYEELLCDPERHLRALCAFLGLTFETKMLTVPADTENLGRAKGLSYLLTSNVELYRTEMSPKLRSQIEALAGPTLRATAYPCEFTGTQKRLSGIRLLLAQLLDGVNLIRRRAANTSVLESAAFYRRYFLMTGNRSRYR